MVVSGSWRLTAVTGKIIAKVPVTQTGQRSPFFPSDPPVAGNTHFPL